ncbi:MAG: hypothetical protein JRN68_10310 [Nitrososphaerota archaeon]|jgi:cell division GTPase FtsZ|nr:hypothetical protein [Nitrososphaerota archaeon]
MTSGGKPLVVGVGTAGSSMVSYMREMGFSAEYLFASFNRKDVPGEYRFFDWRSADQNGTSEYARSLASNAEFVVILGGLGGTSGSFLMPKLCEISDSTGAPTLAIALLPFKKDVWMEFHAATSISRIKRTSSGLIVVDREQFLEERMNEMPLDQLYKKIDEKIAFALVNLLTESEKATEVLCRGQSAMQVGDATSGFISTLASVLRRTVAGNMSDVSDIFLISGGSRPMTFDDSFKSSSGIRNIIAPESRLHFVNGNVKMKGMNMVAMVSHVEGDLKLRISDPLEKLNWSWIDPEPESGIRIPIDIERLD